MIEARLWSKYMLVLAFDRLKVENPAILSAVKVANGECRCYLQSNRVSDFNNYSELCVNHYCLLLCAGAIHKNIALLSDIKWNIIRSPRFSYRESCFYFSVCLVVILHNHGEDL